MKHLLALFSMVLITTVLSTPIRSQEKTNPSYEDDVWLALVVAASEGDATADYYLKNPKVEGALEYAELIYYGYANAESPSSPASSQSAGVDGEFADPGVPDFIYVPVSGNRPAELAHLDERILTYMRKKDVVGLSVAITQGERLVYSRAFGYANYDTGERLEPEHRIRIGSVSKVVTGVAALRLAELNSGFTLNSRVYGSTHLGIADLPGVLDAPEYSLAISEAGLGWFSQFYSHIEVRHLLSHTSGFNKGNKNDNWDGKYAKELVNIRDYHLHFLAGCPLDSIPGTNYDYENHNMGAMGHIIEVVSGRELEEFMRTELLDPSGIDHMVRYGTSPSWRDAALHRGTRENYTLFTVDDYQDRVHRTKGLAAGGWTSSPNDFVRFLCSIQWLGNRPNVLNATSISKMHQNHVDVGRCTVAWRKRDDGTLTHSGSVNGAKAYAAMYPPRYRSSKSEAVNVALFINCNASKGRNNLADDLAESVAEAWGSLRDVDYFPRRASPPPKTRHTVNSTISLK